MAAAVTNLAWGLLEFKDGYTAAGEYGNMLDCLKWPLDYFIKCHIDADTFVGQVTAVHLYLTRRKSFKRETMDTTFFFQFSYLGVLGLVSSKSVKV